MPARAKSIHQCVACHARDRRLAGGIDIGNNDSTRIVHAGAELVEQRLQPGIAMWLHDGDYIARSGLTRRLEHRGDFHRMMTVIVDDRDAASLAGLGETS